MKTIFFLLLFISAFTCGMAQELPSIEYVQGQLSKAKNYTAVFYKKGSRTPLDKATMEKIQMEHLRYLFGLEQKKTLCMFGPLVDNGAFIGMLIFKSSDVAEVKKLVEADPEVKEGFVAYEIHPMVGIPNQGLAD